MAATKKTEEIIEIRPIIVKTVPIRIVGDTPLIVHAWGDKAKQMMLDNMTKKTKTKAREVRNPVGDFIESLYWLSGKPEELTEEAYVRAIESGNAKFGFPVAAIKQAANSAAYRMKWVTNQMELRGAYFLKTEWGDMVEIKGDLPVMREDMVRVGGISKTADIRYRGEFKNWYMDLLIEYNTNGDKSLEQIVNCINAGGYGVGIGEWRPEKDGVNGRYHVEVQG